MAKALLRHSIWTASSREPNQAESFKQEPSNRQQMTSASGTKELCGGGGAAAAHQANNIGWTLEGGFYSILFWTARSCSRRVRPPDTLDQDGAARRMAVQGDRGMV
ncbi:unnamed protein product [Ectocarpus sp. 12 AP-2014]